MIADRLLDAMSQLEASSSGVRAALAEELGGGACSGTTAAADALPISVRLPRIAPAASSSWVAYRGRAENAIERFGERLEPSVAARIHALPSANALALCADPDEIARLAELPGVERIELDDPHLVTAGGGVHLGPPEIGLDSFTRNHPGCGGEGVRVAVIDSGVDLDHPYLEVAESVSVCDESDRVPGLHGTHCAGTIASRDSIHRGIAQNAELLNVKALDAHGRGRHTNVIRGIEAAVAGGAHVLSLSLGFNHQSADRRNGHAWLCRAAECVLCRSVETAVALGHVVVASAGNEFVQSCGHGRSAPTRHAITCPAAAPGAITVATAPASGAKPARLGAQVEPPLGQKPDLVAPGLNVWSTAPAARLGPEASASATRRSELFVRSSGTSVATSIVAGAVALLIEERLRLGCAALPADIRRDLMRHAVTPVPDALPRYVGAGRLDLATF